MFRHFYTDVTRPLSLVGDQVLMNYGGRCNAEFVLHQGFFYPDHAADFMSVPFSTNGGTTRARD